MADAKPETPPVAPTPGFFDADAGEWLWRIAIMAGVVIALVAIFKFIVPIVVAVPAGTWFWRMLMGAILVLGVYKAAKVWVAYIQNNHIENLKWSLLYVKLPRSAPRSIAAMEMVLNALWDTGGTGTWRHLFWDGSVRKYGTLEIVSVEGKIYYFFRVQAGVVDFLKAQIYAQFPEAEVTIVDDYVKYVPQYSAKDPGWVLNGFEIEYEREGEQMFPIKTYIDYGLEKPGEPEERINPMANLLEILASLGPGEQYWIQIHVRAAADRYPVKGESYKKQSWQKQFAGNLKAYEEEVKKTVQSGVATEIEFGKKRVTEYMTDHEKRIYESIQRKMSKRAFDVGIRCIYIAKKELAKNFAHGAVEGALRLFSAPGLNGIKAMNGTFFAAHPWNDVFGAGGTARRDNLYNAYVERSYFYPPYNTWIDEKPRKMMLMSAEEIVTLFHFPGEEVSTGNLSRVEARKAQAPANLPIS